MNIMNNETSFVAPISNIEFFNVCDYILSFGIIFNSKGLINPEVQNQTIPVFNAFFQYLHESPNAMEAKIQLMRQMNNKNNGDTIFDMKYVNETYKYIINEGLFAYYGNITKYLSMRNFAENTNFTALKKIVFDDLSKNYINNVSCSLKNLSSKLKINLSTEAIDNIFADYLWPVFNQTLEQHFENGEDRKLLIHRRLKRQGFDNDGDSDDSSNLDTYFPNLGEMTEVQGVGVEDLLPATENLLSDVENQFWSYDNYSNIQSQVSVDSYELVPAVLDSSKFDFLNSEDGSIVDAAVENLWPTIADSNFSFWPFLDIDSSSNPKIQRIDSSTENQFSGPGSETSYNKDGFVNREEGFQNMTNVQNNRILGQPSFEIDIDDIPGTSAQSEASRIGQFLTSRENRERLGFFDENEVTAAGLDSDDDKKIIAILNSYDDDETVVVLDSDDEDNKTYVKMEANRGSSSTNYDASGLEKIYVQTDYEGRREPIDLIFREMKIYTKTKRMQSIANAAIIISSNERNNYTFEDSLEMLKRYILKIEESSSLVPTYNQLAIDFCKINLNEPEEYNKWKVPNQSIVDDVLFENYFNGTIRYNERKQMYYILEKVKNLESKKNIWDIYRNSSLLARSVRLIDFIILRMYFWDMTMKLRSTSILRVEAAINRLAIRECDEDGKNNITLYHYRYIKQANIFRTSLIGKDNFTFSKITDFSTNEELEISKMKIKPRNNNWAVVLIQIKLETHCGIPNIDRIFEGKGITGAYIIPAHTEFEVLETQETTIEGRPKFILRLQYKRLKEKRMIELINKLHNLVANNPEDIDFYY